MRNKAVLFVLVVGAAITLPRLASTMAQEQMYEAMYNTPETFVGTVVAITPQKATSWMYPATSLLTVQSSGLPKESRTIVFVNMKFRVGDQLTFQLCHHMEKGRPSGTKIASIAKSTGEILISQKGTCWDQGKR